MVTRIPSKIGIPVSDLIEVKYLHTTAAFLLQKVLQKIQGQKLSNMRAMFYALQQKLTKHEYGIKCYSIVYYSKL